MADTLDKSLEDFKKIGRASADALEAVGIFAGKLGHDFNNVLASIQGCAEIMRVRLKKLFPEENPFDRQLKIIDSSVKKGVEITTKIRGFSRPGPIEVSSLELLPIVESAIELVKKSGASVTDIELVARSSPKVQASEFLIAQILMTLVANALDAMAKLQDRTLLIFVGEEVIEAGKVPELSAGRYARISVIDHGVGIKPEHKEKLFTPFFSTKKGGVGEGMGLGLAMARDIMIKLGGTVRIDSAQSRGTAAHLYIPAPFPPSPCT